MLGFHKKLKELDSIILSSSTGVVPVERDFDRTPMYDSLSNKENPKDEKSSAIINALNPVQLDPKTNSEYLKIFFNKKRDFLVPLAQELTEINAQINTLFAFMRFCLTNARVLVGMERPEIQEYLNKKAESMYNSLQGDIKFGGKKNEMTQVGRVLEEFLECCGTGLKHIIKPSMRYEGGYDFFIVGNPGSANITVKNGENGIISFCHRGTDEDAYYEQEYLEAYATEFSQKVVAAGQEMLSVLFPDLNITEGASAIDRKIAMLPASFNFTSLNNIFFKHTGILITTEFVKNVEPETYKNLAKYFSVAVIRNPIKEAISVGKRQLFQNDNETVKFDPAKYLTKEGLALSQTVGFSLVINITKELAEYISQAAKGEKISLLSLNNWVGIWCSQFLKKPRSYAEGGRIKLPDIPRYVLPVSKSLRITEIRKENNLALEKGRGDENGIYIAPQGGLAYLPDQDSRSKLTNVSDYEADLERHLETCFDLGISTSTSVIPEEVLVQQGSKEIEETFTASKDKAFAHSGKVLTYDWDYNIVLTVQMRNPTAMRATNLNGAAKPDALSIGDYLGFNFAKEGEEPLFKSFADSIQLMMNMYPKDGEEHDKIGSAAEPTKMLQEFEPIVGLLQFYKFMAVSGKVPGCAELLKQAVGEIADEDWETLEQSKLFQQLINSDKSVNEFFAREDYDTQFVDRFLQTALALTMKECSGGHTSLMRYRMSLELENPSPSILEEEIKDSPYYFDAANSPAADFGRLYNFVGGAMFRIAMERLTQLSIDQLFNSEPAQDIRDFGNPTKTAKMNKPNFQSVSSKYMPLAVMFSKYIPNAEMYLEEAEKQAETNRPNEEISVDDIRVSGAVAGGQMFPHQVTAHKSLRNQPKFAILDVAPGGGKTSISLTDIGSLVTEMDELGKDQIKPIILCPDNLIKNWVDDMTIFTKDRWNMIPINRVTFDRWGPEKLAEVINNAPPNTIVVAGFNFMSGKKFQVAIGTHVLRISGNIEFLKSFGFNYVAVDESHRMKNKGTTRHKMGKQLTTASFVKFVRILSGTIIADKVKDIVGQTALVNSHIFTDQEFENNLNVTEAIERRRTLELNGEKVPTWEVDTPQRARQKLAKYAAIITMKRKEWAFMMPTPIETFYGVPLEPNHKEATPEEIELGAMHQQLYDAVLQESLEAIEELQKAAQARRARGDDDDDDDDEDFDGDEEELGGDMEIDENDEFAGISQNELKPYIQRLERLVVNPMADPLAPKIFGEAGVTHYVSRKARVVADIVDRHFNPEEWSRDKHYNEHAIAAYKGKIWFARKSDNTEFRAKPLPKETVGIPPDENLDVWKEEPEGKIIIICRYTNSVQGIFDALPAKYQNLAVKYTGAEENKDSNLDAFTSAKDVKILIANENGISEGHNLQMASRIIRVESPWGPGELDQTASRVFRPDPAASKAAFTGGKPGELYRDVIFLDWVLADNTMEVAKQARLIGKVFNKARFDEMESTKKFKIMRNGVIEEANYADILDDFHLEPISMGLETLRSRNSLKDDMIGEYIAGYSQLNALTRQEFHEMRLTQDRMMKDLPEVPLIKGARKIETPFVAGQKAPIVEGQKLTSLKKFVKMDKYSDYRKDPNKLVGKPIITDLGKGQIVRVGVRYQKDVVYDKEGNPVKKKGRRVTEFVTDANGNRIVNDANPISSFTVKLTNGEVHSIPDTGLAFIPMELDNETFQKEYAVGTLSIGKAAEREAEKAAKAAEEKQRKEAIKEARKAAREAKAAENRRIAAADAKKRRANLEEGKPINAGIKKVKKLPDPKNKILQKEKDMHITLHPASFHGFLVLEADAADPDSVDLKKFKFRMSGPYAYVTTDRYARYDKILDYLEDNFEMSPASVNRLVEIQDAFEDGGKQVYRSELAPQSSLPYFFATRKQIVKNRKEIRPYPIIMPDEVLIAVDIKTCPAIKRHIGKSIPGAVAKWQQSPGNALFFAKNKAELKSKVQELKKAGFVIDNLKELAKEIANVQFRQSRGKSKR